MAFKPYQKKMADLLIAMELKVAGLYKLLAEKFPDHCELWLRMHDEELQHAQWIEYLADKVAAGAVLFHEDNTRTNTVQTYLDYVETAIHKVRTVDISMMEALALSADLENSLLERKVFKYFSNDHRDLKETFSRLASESYEHAKKVKDLLDAERKAA